MLNPAFVCLSSQIIGLQIFLRLLKNEDLIFIEVLEILELWNISISYFIRIIRNISIRICVLFQTWAKFLLI